MSDPPLSLALLAGFGEDPLEALLWGQLRESFRLTPEQWKRLTEVVTLHIALDRLLFLRVTVGLTMVAKKRANAERITRHVNAMRFAVRLELAHDAGWLTDEQADDIAAVNSLRNRLLHFDVKRLPDEAPEIATAEAFRAFTQRGMRAWKGLATYLLPLIEHLDDDAPPPGALK